MLASCSVTPSSMKLLRTTRPLSLRIHLKLMSAKPKPIYYPNVSTITWNPMLNIVGVVSCHRKIPPRARAFSRMLRRAGSTRVTLVLLARVNTTLCWTALWVRWRGPMDAPSSRLIMRPPINPLLSRHNWGVRKECWKNRLLSLEGDGIWVLWNYHASTSSRITWIFQNSQELYTSDIIYNSNCTNAISCVWTPCLGDFLLSCFETQYR